MRSICSLLPLWWWGDACFLILWQGSRIWTSHPGLNLLGTPTCSWNPITLPRFVLYTMEKEQVWVVSLNASLSSSSFLLFPGTFFFYLLFLPCLGFTRSVLNKTPFIESIPHLVVCFILWVPCFWLISFFPCGTIRCQSCFQTLLQWVSQGFHPNSCVYNFSAREIKCF